MSTQIVSNFEVLLEPITPIPPSGGQNAAAPRTMRLSQVPRRFRLQGDADSSFPVPEVIQGYFLLIGNPSPSSVTPTVTVEADPYTISLLVKYCLALTQIDGNSTMSTFTAVSAVQASVTLPQVSWGANFAIVGNYASSDTPTLDLRGFVYLQVDTNASLLLNPQTRAIFTTSDPTAAPGEVAYSMITPTGGAQFTFSSTNDAAEVFARSAKDDAPAQVQVSSMVG